MTKNKHKKASFRDFNLQFWGTTSVGGRGQIVIPAKARQYLGYKKGEKLLAFSKGKDSFGLMRIDDMYGMFKQFFGQIENIHKSEHEKKK